MTKDQIRRAIRARKLLLSEADRRSAAEAVFAALERTAHFILADRVLIYASLPDELPTRDFIAKWSRRKQFFLPRVNGVNLELLPFDQTRLHLGSFHIEEPTGNDIVDPSTIDLIIVPAVALDAQGNRLGRGKGFYDRLLRDLRAATIGVGYDFQLIADGIPVEPHDAPLDLIITETHIHKRTAH